MSRRNRISRILFAIGVFLLIAGDLRAEDIKTTWKDGLQFEAEGVAKVHVGGRAQFDANIVSANDEMEASNGGQPVLDTWGFRRLRLQTDGTLYEHAEFKIEIEFGNAGAEVVDAYLGLTGGPAGSSLRAGHIKEPISLEEITSDNYITFSERALPNIFIPSRNVGFLLSATDILEGDKMSAATGVFKDVDSDARFGNDTAEANDSKFSWTTRLTFAPILENKGETLVHLGAGFSYREANQNKVTYSTRPEIGIFSVANSDTTAVPAITGNAISGTTMSTGSLSAVENTHVYDFEVAVGFAGAHLSAEYIANTVHRTGSGSSCAAASDDCLFWGYYVQAGYFLTGESRPYSKGIWGRVRPKNTLFQGGGWGAWEVKARYSHLNLNDAAIRGGVGDDWSAGFNWYWNANFLMRFDYLHAEVKKTTASLSTAATTLGAPIRLPGELDAFLWRFQVEI
ncbi:MAG: porin [Bdellovibrionota bacterium]